MSHQLRFDALIACCRLPVAGCRLSVGHALTIDLSEPEL
jgi:hypothetical protein